MPGPANATTNSRRAHRERAEQAARDAVLERLKTVFPEIEPKVIEDAVRGEFDGYSTSAIKDFVPILVERSVRSELQHRHRA